MKYNFENLDAWKEAIKLIKLVYKISKSLPKEEKFGLTSQLKRAANSIALNIAEGSASKSNKVFRAYLENAKGSLYETVAILKISKELFKINIDEALSNADRLIQIIQGLIRSLK